MLGGYAAFTCTACIGNQPHATAATINYFMALIHFCFANQSYKSTLLPRIEYTDALSALIPN